jgi:hypothetical protein
MTFFIKTEPNTVHLKCLCTWCVSVHGWRISCWDTNLKRNNSWCTQHTYRAGLGHVSLARPLLLSFSLSHHSLIHDGTSGKLQIQVWRRAPDPDLRVESYNWRLAGDNPEQVGIRGDPRKGLLVASPCRPGSGGRWGGRVMHLRPHVGGQSGFSVQSLSKSNCFHMEFFFASFDPGQSSDYYLFKSEQKLVYCCQEKIPVRAIHVCPTFSYFLWFCHLHMLLYMIFGVFLSSWWAVSNLWWIYPSFLMTTKIM